MIHDQPCKIKGRLCSTFFTFEHTTPVSLYDQPVQLYGLPISMYKSDTGLVRGHLGGSSGKRCGGGCKRCGHARIALDRGRAHRMAARRTHRKCPVPCRVLCKSAYKRPQRRVRGNGDGDGAAAAAAASHVMAAAVSVADVPPCAALGRVSAGRVSPICARCAARPCVSFWQRMHGIEK